MRLRSAIRKSVEEERGSFSVEAVLMFPMIVWAFMALYVFFEGLRESNINLKATYTIGDLLSRETELIDEAYLNGMNATYAWLSRSAQPVSLRVTVVRYDAATDKHVALWSRGVAGRSNLTQSEVDQKISPRVPIMADASTAIVVETWTTYDPIMDIGLTDTEIHNVVVTTPRFSEQLMLAGLGDGGGISHNDGTTDTDGL
jgi:hypothetical protein